MTHQPDLIEQFYPQARHLAECGMCAACAEYRVKTTHGTPPPAAALCPGFDEPGEDASISRCPAALVLFNPVIDNSPAGYGNERVDGPWEQFSPLHNITGNCPPTIICLGDSDHLVPVATCEKFCNQVRACGVRCELCITPGAGHDFFNYGCGGGQAYHDTVARMSAFLVELGLLDPTYRKENMP